MSTKSQEALKRQKKTIAIIALVAVVVIVLIALFNHNSGNQRPPAKAPIVELPADKITPQEIWMNRVEADKQLLEKKLSYLEDLILQSKKHQESKEQENLSLRQEIGRLKQELRTMPDRIAQNTPPTLLAQAPPPFELNYSADLFQQTTTSITPEETHSPPPEPKLRQPLQELVMGDATRSLAHVDRTIPAGVTVRAILVSSIDAPCGVLSSADPQPIKLRVLDNGHLPRNVNVKLKGGILIGSAYGDISSERVYMRLERLTQVKPDGHFVETTVAGYVSGEDGRYGVRGTVVDKSKRLVSSAGFSGFLAGISNGLQAAATAYSGANYPYSGPHWDVAREGVGSGSTGALDQLANYYIKRAEQVQPVIQVPAGRVVDITFTLGIEVGDLHAKDKIQQIRAQHQGNP